MPPFADQKLKGRLEGGDNAKAKIHTRIHILLGSVHTTLTSMAKAIFSLILVVSR